MHRISRTSNISVVSCIVSLYSFIDIELLPEYCLKLPRSHMFDRSIGGNPRISKGLKFALDSLCSESSNMARVSAILLMVAQHCGWDNHHRHETLKSHYSSKTTSGTGCVGHYTYPLAHMVQYVSSVYPTYNNSVACRLCLAHKTTGIMNISTVNLELQNGKNKNSSQGNQQQLL